MTGRVPIDGFGNIAFRQPVAGNNGPVFVLFHAIYPGASHRSFSELVTLLDRAGARVYLMDLPGAGQSDKPKRQYASQDLQNFVSAFLSTVVNVPAIVVGEGVMGPIVLDASKSAPGNFAKAVLLSPTGVNTFEEPPTEDESKRFKFLFENDEASIFEYNAETSAPRVRFYLQQCFHDDSRITDDRVNKLASEAAPEDSRWLFLSYLNGQIHRSFQEASLNAQVPVLGLFGATAESLVPEGDVETETDFRNLQPNYGYSSVAEASNCVQRERPEEVAQRLLQFAQ